MLNLEKKLCENWSNRTGATLKAAEKARDYILKKSCTFNISAVNKAEGRETEEEQENKISSRDLSKAQLYTTNHFLHEFERKWGVKSPAVGILFSPGSWKRIRKKIYLEKGVSGKFFPKSYFESYKNKNFPLSKTGLVLIVQDKEIPNWGLGHEALHAAYGLYSKSWREVNKKYEEFKKRKRKKGICPFLRIDMEICAIDELAAFRDNIGKKKKYNWKWVKNSLARGYLNAYLKVVKEETNIDLKKESVYFKKRLPKMISAVKYLQKKLGDKALTRILFTVGPTAKEIKEKRYGSPFDDLLAWKNLVKSNKIDKNYFETHFSLRD